MRDAPDPRILPPTTPEEARPIVALYTDGGMIGPTNPSAYGITWAWVAVAADGARLLESSGCLDAPAGGTLSNNVAEFAAAVLALEAMPAGWAGRLYSDSRLTLGRLCTEWWEAEFHHCAAVLYSLRGIPDAWRDRGRAALGRLGRFTGVLIKGHPTRAALAAGQDGRGFPVSIHNVYCDARCRQESAAWLAAFQLSALSALPTPPTPGRPTRNG